MLFVITKSNCYSIYYFLFFFRKIIKSHHKDDTVIIEEKKKYCDESHKVKNEDTTRVDEVKKIEIKIKSSKLNSSHKCFDNDLKEDIISKPEKNDVNTSKEDNDIKKKSETLKPGHSENKTCGSTKHHKWHDDKETVDTSETENYKKHRYDTDKKFSYNKRIDNRRQESKTDRRIRNKDRPAIEIYRPGMGRLSKLKAENDSIESEAQK